MKLTLEQLRSMIREELEEAKLGIAGSAQNAPKPEDDEQGSVQVQSKSNVLFPKVMKRRKFRPDKKSLEIQKQHDSEPDFEGWISK